MEPYQTPQKDPGSTGPTTVAWGSALTWSAIHSFLIVGIFFSLLLIIPQIKEMFEEFEIELNRIAISVVVVSDRICYLWIPATIATAFLITVNLAVMIVASMYGRRLIRTLGLCVLGGLILIILWIVLGIGLPLIAIVSGLTG